MPRYEDLDWDGLEDFSEERLPRPACRSTATTWTAELLDVEELFMKLYDRLPKEMIFVRELILSALWRSPEHWQVGGDNGAAD